MRCRTVFPIIPGSLLHENHHAPTLSARREVSIGKMPRCANSASVLLFSGDAQIDDLVGGQTNRRRDRAPPPDKREHGRREIKAHQR